MPESIGAWLLCIIVFVGAIDAVVIICWGIVGLITSIIYPLKFANDTERKEHERQVYEFLSIFHGRY